MQCYNLVIFKELNEDNWIEIENEPNKVKGFIDSHSNDILCGFNSKWYDNWVTSAAYYGADTTTLKALNDWIIVDRKNGWEFPFLNYKKKKFLSMDLRDDIPMDLSLKEIEGNLYMDITESSIPFDYPDELTEEQKYEMRKYCRHDVLATERLYNERLSYINCKKVIAKIGGLDERYCLTLTNAKLTSLFLGAEQKNRSIEDVRNYKIPDCIRLDRIPKEVIDFFNNIYDESIPMEHLLDTKHKDETNTLNITLGNCPCVIAMGGIHGSNGNENINNDEKLILNYDVASLYPSSIINFDYYSRNTEEKLKYKFVRDSRVSSKLDGGKAFKEKYGLPEDADVVGGLKLILNTYYGALGQKYSDLFDPLMAKSVCITNQLAMVDLIQGLLEKCPSIFFNNINTDGIMFMIDPDEKPLALEVIDEWQSRTGFELEEDNIMRYISKDVNNYFMEFTNGKVKAKGGYIGRYKGGNFIKNSAIIVQKAVVELLDKGIAPHETILNCDDIFQFQIIAKTGSKYKSCFYDVNGELVEVQKTNRVYASLDTRLGKLLKYKEVNGKPRYDSIAGLPTHCAIDNANVLTINDIDKNFYIEEANKRAFDFLYGRNAKKQIGGIIMATKTTTKVDDMNIYQKLAMARLDFIKANVKKTGKNRHMSYMYFTLDDIVPPATEILSKYGLVALINVGQFDDFDTASAVVTDGVDKIEFNVPFVMPKPILNKDGNAVNNPIQDLGSSLTYTRRYLWMNVLDITEHDPIDGDTFEEPTEVAKPKEEPKKESKKKAPLTKEEKKEKVEEVINNQDEVCNQVTLDAIKKGLGALKELVPMPEEYIRGVIGEINEAKGQITMVRANEILAEINDKLEGK